MLANINQRIRRLCDERHAVILAHNYQCGEVQDLADYVGDSLGLSQIAAKTSAEVIVFCGVHFMAETAAILCPDKIVLLPDMNAGCPMANMITARELNEFKAEYPGAIVVTYVNSSAAIKAMSDICCTSANADEIVARFSRDKKILFIPDRNLGHYVAEKLKREIICWHGYCPTHERILPDHVEAVRREHPTAMLVVHPECRPVVVKMADAV
ncbi:MAG: quinolinate synthase NadA, partial [Planctomycetes bacterium]|nr:quinolinate synthase NadA [Planctomycetota bacterium]